MSIITIMDMPVDIEEMGGLPGHEDCFACDRSNPGGLGLRFSRQKGSEVAAAWKPGNGCRSYPDRVHGGLLATVLDCAMVHALHTMGVEGVTAELTLRYRKPVVPDEPVEIRARVESTRHGVHQCSAEMLRNGLVMVSATGKFLRKPGVVEGGSMTTITLLVENTARPKGILGEHGLSWWIDTGRHRVLFDTGQGMALEHNAMVLGIDLRTVDAVVLSHGHYDHVSGLEAVRTLAPKAVVWIHSAAVNPKFLRAGDDSVRRISIPYIESLGFAEGAKVRWVDGPAEVVPGVWVSGSIPRVHAIEDVGGAFFLDEAMRVVDPIEEDMAVYLPDGNKMTVVFGCAHAGAINTLQHLSGHHPGCKPEILLGGLHLGGCSDERLEWTMRRLREVDARCMGFGHCTGVVALRRLHREFPDRCVEIHAGWRLRVED